MVYALVRDGEAVWRLGATAKEAARVARIDRDLERLETKRGELTRERRRLTNRACQRARRSGNGNG